MTTTTTTTGECFKCNGTGRLPTFSHIAAGVCFTCKGTGEVQFANKPAAPTVVEVEDESLTARRITAIYTADLSKWTFKQLHAARQFAVARIDIEPHVYDAWMDRGEAYYRKQLDS